MISYERRDRWTQSQWSLYRRLRVWEDRTHAEAVAIVEAQLERKAA